jgi:hypothetical protein
MAKPDEDYEWVEVESYIPSRTGGLHGKVHIRPVAGQRHPTTLHVECSRRLKRDYPPGTRFRILAKLTDREGTDFLYSNPRDEPHPL